MQDWAKHLAALFLSDLTNDITTVINPDFTPWRYGRDLGGPDFGPLAEKLAREPSLSDREFQDLRMPIWRRTARTWYA